jgi:hypothetical protein
MALLCPALALAGEAADAGRRLVQEHSCESCHASRATDGKPIYLRQDRKVTSLPKLKAQVAFCNSELNLQLFPDDEEKVVAFLDEAYYRFSPSLARPSDSRSIRR